MRFTLASLSTLVLSTLVSAAPITNILEDRSGKTCPVSSFKLALPAGQTLLSIPAGVEPAYVALGVGIQNYTCTNGAFAYVFRILSFIFSNAYLSVRQQINRSGRSTL
jgi:hypothetical protein